MAWTADRWPLSEGDPCDTRFANELRTELNARHGTSVIADAFTDGESTWDVVSELRGAVEGKLLDFHDPATGKTWAHIGDDDSSLRISIFKKLFGSTRRAWINQPGTEATAADYDPQACGLPYITYLNELYSVINALKWLHLDKYDYEDAGGDGALTKNGATCASATKQGALDAAWASMVADTPGVDASNYALQRCGFYTEIQYKSICSSSRSFFYFTPPVGAQSVAAYITGVWHNFYASTTGPTFCPSWRAQLYTSATTPGTITSADWGFGTLRRSFTMPDVISGYTIATAYAWTGGPISGWTAGAMEYAQLRIEGDDTTIPQFVVTSGDWSAGGPAAYKGAAPSYYLRLLYSLV